MRRIILFATCLILTMSFQRVISALPEGSPGGNEMAETAMAKAVAVIAGTQADSMINGTVKFEETTEGVKVTASLSGVPVPGKHGFHIHQYGSCGEAGNAAGSHYNPHSVKHGYLPGDGLEQAHLGDMGNIVIDEDGGGSLTVELAGVSISGENDIAGRAVILHEKEDDFGQPTGNAGARIGCGTIVIVGE